MKVSVIMPCYNGEKYLEACIDSVLAQTMPDFELIVIDDGSSDGTLHLAQRYAQKDSRVQVVFQANSGVSAARNRGLSIARGEWITFVDCDDLLPPDALETLLSAADEETDMVVAAHETFDEAGCVQAVIPQSRWMDYTGEEKRRRVCLRLIEGDAVLNIMCCKLHRRSMIEREEIRLNPGVRIAEDALFNLEAALCGREIRYINRVAYRYRMHSASCMHTQKQSELKRHAPWLMAMRDMLIRRCMMERYYGAYLDSVVLRLYKDSGVPGVIREFNCSARAFLPESMEAARLSCGSRLLRSAVHAGIYPALYPFIFVWQTAVRKAGEAAFALRAKGEMPE